VRSIAIVPIVVEVARIARQYLIRSLTRFQTTLTAVARCQFHLWKPAIGAPEDQSGSIWNRRTPPPRLSHIAVWVSDMRATGGRYCARAVPGNVHAFIERGLVIAKGKHWPLDRVFAPWHK